VKYSKAGSARNPKEVMNQKTEVSSQNNIKNKKKAIEN
jgi:hypothetical protein